MIAVVVVGISVSGLAQQNSAFRVKHSAPEKPPKSTVPIGKTAASAKASTANSRELQALEHQTAKSSVPPRSAGKRAPGTAPALKSVKDKPNPPINFGGTGGGKSAGSTRRGSDPYAGRLKQKRAHP
jgi:hypothetical protein